jgi:ABC-type transport system involved in multi-copper enzyme maturation permease subunit
MFRHIWWKEIRAELYTWKSLLWLLIASLILSFTSYLLLTNRELSLLDQTEMLWLLSKIIIGVALLIVSIDASSIIASEFEKETAETLFVAPLRVRDFLLGKFLACLTLWAALYIVAIPYMLVTSAGTRLALPFLIYVAILGSGGVSGIVAVIFGISLLFRSSRNTLTTSLILLLALSIPALFSSTLKNNFAAQLFGRINPIDNVFSSLDNVLVDAQTSLLSNWSYLAPLLLFDLIAAIFLIIAARQFQQRGVIEGA